MAYNLLRFVLVASVLALAGCGAPTPTNAPALTTFKASSTYTRTSLRKIDLSRLVGKKIEVAVVNPRLEKMATIHMTGDGLVLKDSYGNKVPVRNTKELEANLNGLFTTVVRTAYVKGTVTVKKSVTTRTTLYALEIEDFRFELGEPESL